MWSECSWVIRIADSECGSSPKAFIRLKVSRQEIPASTKILVQVLETMAQFPRLPDASMDTLTPIRVSILGNPVDSGVTFWLADTYERLDAGFVKTGCRISGSSCQKSDFF